MIQCSFFCLSLCLSISQQTICIDVFCTHLVRGIQVVDFKLWARELQCILAGIPYTTEKEWYQMKMELVETDLDTNGQKNTSQSDKVISDTHQEHEQNTGDQASKPESLVPPGHITPLSMRAKLRDQGFRERIAAITQQAKDAKGPLLPVHEVLIKSFIHPGDPSKPSRISTGVLTGGKPLWAFTVDERGGHGDLYYFAYDNEVRDRWSDGTRVINLMGLVLVKAQIEVEGTMPALKDMLRSAVRVFGGYTRFTSAIIHGTGHCVME